MSRATVPFLILIVTVSLLVGLAPYVPALPVHCVETSVAPQRFWIALGEKPQDNATGVGALVIPPGCTATVVGKLTRIYFPQPYSVYNLDARAAIYLPERANLTSFPSNPQTIYPTSSVRISASPGSIPPTISNATVVFTVTTTTNSTGFYFLSFEGSVCPQVWLAVTSPPVALNPSYWGSSYAVHCTPFQFYFQITSLQGAWIARIA